MVVHIENMTKKETNVVLKPADLEAIERVIYRNGDDIAVSIGRSFERLEERIDAAKSRLISRLSEIEDKTEACRQDISDELGEVREELRVRIPDEK